MRKKNFKTFSNRKVSAVQLLSKVICCTLILTSTLVSAQVPGFDDDVNDETGPAAPLDNGIILLSCLGVAYGFYFMRKNNQLETNALIKKVE